MCSVTSGTNPWSLRAWRGRRTGNMKRDAGLYWIHWWWAKRKGEGLISGQAYGWAVMFAIERLLCFSAFVCHERFCEFDVSVNPTVVRREIELFYCIWNKSMVFCITLQTHAIALYCAEKVHVTRFHTHSSLWDSFLSHPWWWNTSAILSPLCFSVGSVLPRLLPRSSGVPNLLGRETTVLKFNSQAERRKELCCTNTYLSNKIDVGKSDCWSPKSERYRKTRPSVVERVTSISPVPTPSPTQIRHRFV